MRLRVVAANSDGNSDGDVVAMLVFHIAILVTVVVVLQTG